MDHLSIPIRPAATRPARSIHLALWEAGFKQFDGIHPVLVYRIRHDTTEWTFHIENYKQDISCITRQDGIVRDVVPMKHYL